MSNTAKETDSDVVNILNVGTKVLRKDLMDQYIRKMGDYRTYYADSIKWALRSFSERAIHILIVEVELNDGSAYRLWQALDQQHDHYTILVGEAGGHPQSICALAQEIDANSVLTAPFGPAELKTQIELFQKWRAEQKEPWRALLRKAIQASRSKSYAEAEKNFQAAIQVAPDNPIPLCKAGIYYLGKPNYKVAQGFLEQAIEIKPDYIQALTALGLLFLATNELAKAQKFLNSAQVLSPLNPDRLVKLANLHMEFSLKFCQESLRIEPKSGDARLNIGKILFYKKDYVGAIQQLERAIPDLPDSKDDLRTQAKGYIALARKLGGLKSD